MTVEECLEDLPRPGTPPHLKANEICQIEELACEKPESSGRPITQWTGREIADEIKKRGIVDKISPRHESRLLKKKSLRPHLIRYWLTLAPDERFDEKIVGINRLYQQAQFLEQNVETVISTDEMTGVQALEGNYPGFANGIWKRGKKVI